MKRNLKIVTELVLDSYDRGSRWRAIDDNTFDGDNPNSPCGYGATEIEAVRELLTQIEEKQADTSEAAV